jgi:hypothetical protein
MAATEQDIVFSPYAPANPTTQYLHKAVESLDVGLIANPKLPPRTAPTSAIRVPLDSATVLTVPDGVGLATRSIVLAQICAHGLKAGIVIEAGSMILTAMEWALPGSVKTLEPSRMDVTITFREMRDEEIEFLTMGTIPQVANPDPAPQNPPAGAPPHPLLVDQDIGEFMPGFWGDQPFDDSVPANVDPFEAIFLFGVILFAIAKDATTANYAAFTTNRVEAFRTLTGTIGDGAGTLLTAATMPAVNELRKIKGWWNAHARARYVVIEAMVQMEINSPGTTTTATIGMFTTLWRDSGLNHVRLIARFMVNNRAIITRIPQLTLEATRFVLQYNAWAKAPKSYKSPYEKVIFGNKPTTIPSARDFPELLKLARWDAAAEDQRLVNYASQVGDSVYQQEFLRQARLLGVHTAHGLAQGDLPGGA